FGSLFKEPLKTVIHLCGCHGKMQGVRCRLVEFLGDNLHFTFFLVGESNLGCKQISGTVGNEDLVTFTFAEHFYNMAAFLFIKSKVLIAGLYVRVVEQLHYNSILAFDVTEASLNICCKYFW